MEFNDHQHLAAGTLTRALRAHEHWKHQLQKAVESGEILDAAGLSKNDCCELGKWLIAEGKTLYGSRPEFVRLVAKHTEFHQVAGTVAHIINTSRTQDLSSLLQRGSQYSYASTDVRFAILQLQRGLQKELPSA